MSPVRRTNFEGTEPVSLAQLDELVSDIRRKQAGRTLASVALIVLGATVIGVAGVEMVYEVAGAQSPVGSLALFLSGAAAAIAGAVSMLTANKQIAQLERARDRLLSSAELRR